MILEQTLTLFAGGPGSGCNPDAGRCGRLPTGVSVINPGDKFHNEAEWLDTTPGSRRNPVHVGNDTKKALKLIRQNKHVQLDKPRDLYDLIQKIGREVQNRNELGEPQLQYNIGGISVKNKPEMLGDLGIPREDMPQLGGWLDPGSPLLPKGQQPGPGYEVDMGPAFLNELKDSGVTDTDENVPVGSLHPTQDELDGARIASMISRPQIPLAQQSRIFVTKDNYILDGHHHWASQVVMDAKDNRFGDTLIPVHKLNIGISDVFDRAIAFQKKYGISKALVSGRPQQEWLPGLSSARMKIDGFMNMFASRIE